MGARKWSFVVVPITDPINTFSLDEDLRLAAIQNTERGGRVAVFSQMFLTEQEQEDQDRRQKFLSLFETVEPTSGELSPEEFAEMAEGIDGAFIDGISAAESDPRTL